MRSWLRDRLACAEARANAWLYLYGQGNRVESLSRLRVPNAVLLPCIFIDPMKIQYKCNIRGEAQARRTLFRDGDWDVRRKSFAEVDSTDPRYISCAELLGSMPVEQTLEFQRLQERLLQRGEARGMRTLEQLRDYLQVVRGLYRQVAADGRLRTQDELGLCRYGGEINCAVGRDGQLLKTDDGNHRFALARHLKLQEVPVQISVIHSACHRHLPVSDKGSSAVNAFLKQLQERYA